MDCLLGEIHIVSRVWARSVGAATIIDASANPVSVASLTVPVFRLGGERAGIMDGKVVEAARIISEEIRLKRQLRNRMTTFGQDVKPGF
jgi:hypothetical protein